jgi:hypothetical protein
VNVGARRRAAERFSRIRTEGSGAQRELLVVAIALLALGRLVDASVAWVVALLLGTVVASGVRAGFQAEDPQARATVPGEAGLVAGVLAGVLLLAGRFVPLDGSFMVALIVAALLLLVAVVAEARAVAHGGEASGRVPILVVAVVTAFVGFAAVAGLVAGGLSLDTAGAPGELSGGPGGLSEIGLLVLAAADALIAGLLGYRLARLLPVPPRAALAGAASSAAVVALAAGLLRAIAVPVLAAPVILTIVFALWDAVRSSSVALRRDPRWLLQLGLLGVLGLVVVGWNLALR